MTPNMTKLETILRDLEIYVPAPERKLGVQGLAKKVGLNRSTILSHISKRRVMRKSNLKKIAEYLNIDIQDLLD